MAYTGINKSTDYFNTKLWNGNSSTQAITGVGFQPDFVWGKQRSSTQSHQLLDAIRGANNIIISNTDASAVADSNILNSFDSDGFTLGNQDQLNDTGATYASWNWKANGSGSANTDGTINTTATSVNTTAGFSISKYVGNDTAGATVGHGLGAVPKMIIVKRISGSAQDWIVYHGANTSAPETDYLQLNATAATADSSGVWNDTAPTSSVFSLGSASSVNGGGGSDSFIAYCFAEKTGYSKFGSYTGNGSSSAPTFIYTGFKPKFVMVKNTSQTDSWFIHDDKRDGYNDDNEYLFANLTQAEGTNVNRISMYSNGFNVPTTDKSHNVSGNVYVYAAFGQSLVGSNNVPCTAR